MVTKRTLTLKFAILISLLSVVIMLQFLILPTVSRLRDVHLDEVRGYYTALHLSHDGEGKVVALEEQYVDNTPNGYKGSFSFTINNFDNYGITQRDISYKIYSKEILRDTNGDYYVTGVWGRKIDIKPATINYTVNIVGEGSTVSTATEHTLQSYATIDPESDPVGTSASHMIEIHRKPDAPAWDEENEVEEITIVIELTSPYHEIVVANITVSPRLIVYSISKVDKFHTTAYRLHIQTASSFKRISSGANSYLPDAFRVILNWEGLYFDNTFNEVLKHTENGQPDSSKISTPTLITPNQITTQKTLQMYIPAGSDFYIDFYANGSGTPQIYTYAELKNSDTKQYAAYTKYNYSVARNFDIYVTVGTTTVNNISTYLIPQ